MISQPQIQSLSRRRPPPPSIPRSSARANTAFYRVVFNALEESVEWPGKITGPPQLEMRPGAHGEILQMTGTNLEPRTSFNYRVRATSLGTFTLPEFVVTVYGKSVTVPAAQLEVVAAPPATVRPAQHAHDRACPLPTWLLARRFRCASYCRGSPGALCKVWDRPN